MPRCDVLVVGAGPAGASAGCQASREGADVLIVERKPEAGSPVQCAEYIPRPLLSRSGLGRSVVSQEVRGMRTFLPNGGEVFTNAPGFTIDRQGFDRGLLERAVESGAELRVLTRAVRNEEELALVRLGVGMKVEPKVVIGADGPNSLIGRWAGSINSRMMVGAQHTVELVEEMDETEVHFRHDLFGGYGWIFPKGDTANVGIGVVAGTRYRTGSPKVLLTEFCREMERIGRIRFEPSRTTGGFIPVGGPLKCVIGNTILVGDSAGQTHPITGGGLPQAVLCGREAGRASARAVAEGEPDLLKDYESECNSLFGPELARGLERRNLLEREWDNLDNVITDCWVAFGGYYGRAGCPDG